MRPPSWRGHRLGRSRRRGCGPGQAYGFRVHGPWDPAVGARCNPAKLLLDRTPGPSTARCAGTRPSTPRPRTTPTGATRPTRLLRAPLGGVHGRLRLGRRPPPGHPDAHYHLRDPCEGVHRPPPGVPEALWGTYAGRRIRAVVGRARRWPPAAARIGFQSRTAAHTPSTRSNPAARALQCRVDQAVDLDAHPRSRAAPPAGRIRRRRSACSACSRPPPSRSHRQHRDAPSGAAQTLAVELHRGGVDQEGHVVVDDLDHRVARSPAVSASDGPKTRSRALAGCMFGAELPARQQRPEQVFWAAHGQVVVVQVMQPGLREGLEGHRLLGCDTRCSQRARRRCARGVGSRWGCSCCCLHGPQGWPVGAAADRGAQLTPAAARAARYDRRSPH